MKLAAFFGPSNILINHSAGDKEQTLVDLCGRMALNLGLQNREALTRAILDREAIVSTGMGEGIAIPHAKCDQIKDLTLFFAKLEPAIPFDSPDGKDVDLVFLLSGPPEKTQEHVRLLAALARFLQKPSLRESLRAAGTLEEVIECLNRAERDDS